MPQFIKRRPMIIVILLAVLLIVLAVATSGHREDMTAVEGIVGDVLSPVQGFMYRIATYVSNSIESVRERSALAENHELLQQRVAELEQQLLNQNETMRENERLRRLLDYKRNWEEFTVTTARVTGKNPGNWFNTFTIDKGSRQGVAVDMAVMTDHGLVGRVIDVGTNWAKVRSVVDGQSAVSGIIARTRDTGIVRGSNGLTFEDGMVRMVHLPLDSDVTVGDIVITSGLGEIFPKGIYIGEVIEVIEERRDLFRTAVVAPGADFRRLEEVLVVKESVN